MSLNGISSGTFDLTSLKALRHAKGLELFKNNDRDQSDDLTFSEFQNTHKANPLAPHHQAKNTDEASLEEIFAHLDADKNGQVTIKEFRNAKPPAPAGNSA